jgi:hypothetical protein
MYPTTGHWYMAPGHSDKSGQYDNNSVGPVEDVMGTASKVKRVPNRYVILMICTSLNMRPSQPRTSSTIRVLKEAVA